MSLSRRIVGRTKQTTGLGDDSSVGYNSFDAASPSHVHQFEQKMEPLELEAPWVNYNGTTDDVAAIYRIGNYVQLQGIVAQSGAPNPDVICNIPPAYLPDISKLPYTFVTSGIDPLGSVGLLLVLQTNGNLQVQLDFGQVDLIFLERVKYAQK